jgi:hypothetical protein
MARPNECRVKAVINLEAAGAGGPALAFQIGSADLAYAYSSVVPYPHTMVTVRCPITWTTS